jgi:hypothetical protein
MAGIYSPKGSLCKSSDAPFEIEKYPKRPGHRHDFGDRSYQILKKLLPMVRKSALLNFT